MKISNDSQISVFIIPHAMERNHKAEKISSILPLLSVSLKIGGVSDKFQLDLAVFVCFSKKKRHFRQNLSRFSPILSVSLKNDCVSDKIQLNFAQSIIRGRKRHDVFPTSCPSLFYNL
jgi:hypothetical protein